MITKQDLVVFLEKMVEDIHHGKITETQLQNLSIFYIQSKYEEEMDSQLSDSQKSLKYLTLGWYIHHFLVKK